MAPEGEERVGDVSNVLFSNGWIDREDGSVVIYYASSDSRMHAATSTIDQLVDYVKNTPPDGYTSTNAVNRVMQIIMQNL
jgi:4-O-beta-D-mannosyl-D-glucose phosphorylase